MWRLIRLGVCGCMLIGLLVEGASAFFLTSRAITSVFDTTRNSTGNAVFSNGNATVTAGPGTVTNVQLSAFTNVVHSSGKYAFRVTENACTSAGLQGCAIGLGSAAAADNTYLGSSTASVGIFDSGNVFVNGASVGSGPGFLVGNTIDVAVDLDGKTISHSVNGGAFSTPVSIAGLAGFLLSPAVTMNAATDAFTYNGNVSFPGFAAWNSAPSPPVTMTVSLSPTTFTSGVANSTVGTVAVTNSSGPASSATLSLTGANTGGFHLSGTTPGSSLLTAGGSGTAAGTYSDLNIVATQVGISNSPQQISPSLVGSAGGAVPAPAQAAGFTTLIRNDNFQTLGAPSGWYDCAMSGGTPLYYRAWVGFGSIDGPCNAVTVEADTGRGGQTALKIHWQDSYFSNVSGAGHTIPIQTTDSAGNNGATSRGFYLEVVARTDYIGSSAFDSAWMGLWSLAANNLAGYEIDGFEEATGSSGQKLSSNIHNHTGGVNYDSCAWIVSGQCGGCPPSVGCSFDITQYHTYAWRQTSAGSDIIFCSYIDGALEGCNTISPSSAQLSGVPMAHQFGVNVSGTNTPLGNGSTGKNAWIKSIKVWSCDTNPNNNCNSSSNNPT